MQPTESRYFDEDFARLDPADPQYATEVVDRVLAAGRAAGASDMAWTAG